MKQWQRDRNQWKKLQETCFLRMIVKSPGTWGIGTLARNKKYMHKKLGKDADKFDNKLCNNPAFGKLESQSRKILPACDVNVNGQRIAAGNAKWTIGNAT